MQCRLYNASLGPALGDPEQWGATHLKPSQMSTETFSRFLLKFEPQPSQWPGQTHHVEMDK